jgi:hypothetical protein
MIANMTITEETAKLLIDFASYVLYVKNDDWWHKLEWDKEFAQENLKMFLENRNIEVVKE